MIEELSRLMRNIKVMSHRQVKEESASASRLQKHEITCVKHFRKCVSRKWKTFMKVWDMGSAACRNEGHCPPPPFSLGRLTMILAPQISEVYNNSNLVNNKVFKKLTTKFASMKYYGNLVWYHLLNLLTQLLDFLLYMIKVYSQ